jgi:3-oxoacyl-[acyl-carrier-protein] synthase II
MTAAVAPPVITAWSAVSPFGIGRAAFTRGLRSGRSSATEVPAQRWQVPDPTACLVPDLETGKKSRALDRVTLLALAAVADLGEPPQDCPADRTAMVLGTTSGSLASSLSVTRDSLVNARPHHVDPKALAAGVMNYAATQCAIRYGFTGPNTTIAGGRAAGQHALVYARRLLTAGRADTVLAGAVEEFSEPRAWLAHHNGDVGRPLGEGSVLLRLERADSPRPPLAQLLAADSRVCFDTDLGSSVRASVTAVLARADVRPEDVWAVACATGTETERATAVDLFGQASLDRLPDTAPIGDTGAAGAAFSVVAVLSGAEALAEAAGRAVVVVSTDPDGGVMSVLLRLMGGKR